MSTQLINFTIPNKLLGEVDKLAKKEGKSRSAVLREAAHLITARKVEKERNFKAIQANAKSISMTEQDAINLVDKIRSEIQINK